MIFSPLVLWTVTVASIIGTIANVQQKRWCFKVWLCSNAYLVAYNAYVGCYPQAVLFTVYAGLSIWGILAWKSSQKDQKDAQSK